MLISNLHRCPDQGTAIRFYHACWGNPHNFNFFADALRHSRRDEEKGLPRFYFLLEGERIIGCCGLIAADFVSRGDLSPWVCGLFVEPAFRGQGLGGLLLAHAAREARQQGFAAAHLATDHAGYYERYGWQRIEDGYDLFSGDATRLYRLAIQPDAAT